MSDTFEGKGADSAGLTIFDIVAFTSYWKRLFIINLIIAVIISVFVWVYLKPNYSSVFFVEATAGEHPTSTDTSKLNNLLDGILASPINLDFLAQSFLLEVEVAANAKSDAGLKDYLSLAAQEHPSTRDYLKLQVFKSPNQKELNGFYIQTVSGGPNVWAVTVGGPDANLVNEAGKLYIAALGKVISAYNQAILERNDLRFANQINRLNYAKSKITGDSLGDKESKELVQSYVVYENFKNKLIQIQQSPSKIKAIDGKETSKTQLLLELFSALKSNPKLSVKELADLESEMNTSLKSAFYLDEKLNMKTNKKSGLDEMFSDISKNILEVFDTTQFLLPELVGGDEEIRINEIHEVESRILEKIGITLSFILFSILVSVFVGAWLNFLKSAKDKIRASRYYAS